MKRGKWLSLPRLTGKALLGLFLALALLLAAGKARTFFDRAEKSFWRTSGAEQAEGSTAQKLLAFMQESFFCQIWQRFYPSPFREGQGTDQGQGEHRQSDPDPAYRTAKAEETGKTEAEEKSQSESRTAALQETSREAEQAASAFAFPGKTYQLAQLEDYDFLMSHFYSVHTSTTAGRELMDAKKLLSRDFRLSGTADAALPQILIYHTHSQEAFADSEEGENIVAVGEYLAQLLRERGFSVYHDQSVYDIRDGKLDRNKAYTYALEGITQILETYPSIQVIIDLHRDGVREGTRLVTEVNGKPTAQIMFFNGLSQTPEGPVPYLENPYREDNLSFSLQLQLKAEAYFPGFARKIYLKGLRYNQHLRPASCLVEAGAQTNTYQEVQNAMEPLAEVFTMLLQGK